MSQRHYDDKRQMIDHPPTLFSIDNVLFTVHESQLKVLLVRRAIEPFTGRWSLPGGYVDANVDNNVEQTALRKLKEKTGVKPGYLEQLKVFSGHERDPRGFSVTLAFYALIGYQDASTHIETVSEADWLPVKELDKHNIAFDHADIVEAATDRLQQKALYSMLPVYCLSEHFTITQLKQVIEIIIGKSIQRKTLMRRIEASGMFEEVEEKANTGTRPAQVYRIKDGADIYHFERNLT